MRKIILLAHISLDGFVAGPKGELDGFDASEENLRFVCQLTEEADAALLGRISYELLNSYWPTAKDRPKASEGEIAFSRWYNSAHKIVVSRTTSSRGVYNTTIIPENITGEIVKLREEPGKNILIFGSPSISRLLMENKLVDSYWIFVNPVIFGEGISLFKGLTKKIQFELLTTKNFSNGEVAMNFVPKN